MWSPTVGGVGEGTGWKGEVRKCLQSTRGVASSTIYYRVYWLGSDGNLDRLLRVSPVHGLQKLIRFTSFFLSFCIHWSEFINHSFFSGTLWRMFFLSFLCKTRSCFKGCTILPFSEFFLFSRFFVFSTFFLRYQLWIRSISQVREDFFIQLSMVSCSLQWREMVLKDGMAKIYINADNLLYPQTLLSVTRVTKQTR